MTFDDIIKNKPLHLQNIASNMRQLILGVDASLQEHVYGGDKIKILLFHLGDKNNVLYGLQATDKYCTLYLHHCDDIDTSSLKLEPSGKQTKSLKVFHQTDVKPEKIIPLLKKILISYKNSTNEVQETVKSPSKKVVPVIKKITLENPKAIMRKKKK